MNNTQDYIHRSVASLERIYAVVVALAVTIAVNSLMFGSDGKILPYLSDSGPSLLSSIQANGANLLAFIVTMVPFYHGMQRHLDKTYVEREVSEAKQGFLLLDFFVFFIESCLLVAFASSLSSGTQAMIPLMILLGIDAFWSVIAFGIHYSDLKHAPWKWALINVLAIICIYFFMNSSWFDDEASKLWGLALIACLRTGADYLFTWKFYFPTSSD